MVESYHRLGRPVERGVIAEPRARLQRRAKPHVARGVGGLPLHALEGEADLGVWVHPEFPVRVPQVHHLVEEVQEDRDGPRGLSRPERARPDGLRVTPREAVDDAPSNARPELQDLSHVVRVIEEGLGVNEGLAVAILVRLQRAERVEDLAVEREARDRVLDLRGDVQRRHALGGPHQRLLRGAKLPLDLLRRHSPPPAPEPLTSTRRARMACACSRAASTHDTPAASVVDTSRRSS